MPFVIAVGGKGGVGKTTISGLIVRYLLNRGKKPILAIDADANANFNEVLGVKVTRTIGSLREETLKEIKNLPAGVFKETYWEYKLEEAIVEAKGFDLLVMGRPEGPRCYCYANDVLRKYMDIIAQNYPYVVMDNEAGLEHLSRRTTHNVDLFFIVSDSSLRGIRTAARIRDLIKELNLDIRKLCLIVNRVEILSTEAKEEMRRLDLDLAGLISNCPQILDYDLKAKPIFELPEQSPAVSTMDMILEGMQIL